MPNIADDLDDSATPRSTKRGKSGESEPLLGAEDKKAKDKSKSRKGARVQLDVEDGEADEDLLGLCNGIVHVSAVVNGTDVTLPLLLPGMTQLTMHQIF